MADAAGSHTHTDGEHTGGVWKIVVHVIGHGVQPAVDGESVKVNSSRQILLFIVTYVIRQVLFLSPFDLSFWFVVFSFYEFCKALLSIWK